MKKSVIVALCCVVGLAGVGAGALVALRFGGLMADAAVLTRAEADLAIGTRIREHLQAGENDRAAELLDAQLDGSLVTIDAFVSNGVGLTPQTYERLERLRVIRDGSGYRPADATVASAVDRALILTREPIP